MFDYYRKGICMINQTENFEQGVFQTKGKFYIQGRSGSGKTTLLLKRLQYLREEGISFKKVLNLTAYKEDTKNLERLWKESYDPCGEDVPSFKSIYQFCFQILYRYHQLYGGTQPHVSRDFRLQVSKMIQEFFGIQLNHYELDEVYKQLCICRGQLMDEAQIQQITYPNMNFYYLFQQFEKYKKQRSLMSYEDLMVEAYQCLLKEESLRRQIREQIRFIHVDDAQNLSLAAHKMLQLISDEQSSVALFIDNDQYAGSHAPYRLRYEEFLNIFPDAVKIELDHNYRCDANIDEMIQKFMHSDYDFHLQDDSVVRFLTAKDLDASYHQALILAKNDSNMVFLSREHFTLLPLADLLDKENIPFHVSNFHSFFRDNTIHDLLALFRLMMDPKDYYAFTLIQKKIGFGLSDRNLNEIEQMLQEDDSLDIYSAIFNSSIRSSTKNRVIKHIEEIRIAQHLDSIKMLLFVLTKLHYEDYIKQKGVTIKNPNILVFATMAQRYKDPAELLERFKHLMSIEDEQEHSISLYSFSQVKGKVFEEVCFLDCLDAFYQVFPDQIQEKRFLYSILSKISKRMVFLVAKTAFMQKMTPHAFIHDLYLLMKAKDAGERKERKTKEVSKATLRSGKRIVHKTLGNGRIRRIFPEDDEIEIVFADGVAKRLKLSACLESALLSFH